MLRRFTGLLLTATLTLLSISQGAGCMSHEAPATAAHHSMSMVNDTSAPHHDCGDAPPAQPCGHMAFGDCAGMSSCSAPTADVVSAAGVAAPVHQQVVTRLVSASAGPVASPETPPPRA